MLASAVGRAPPHPGMHPRHHAEAGGPLGPSTSRPHEVFNVFCFFSVCFYRGGQCEKTDIRTEMNRSGKTFGNWQGYRWVLSSPGASKDPGWTQRDMCRATQNPCLT